MTGHEGAFIFWGDFKLAHTARCKLQTAASVTPESPTLIGLFAKGLLSSACQPVTPVFRWGPARGDGQATTKISLYEEAITRFALQQQEEEKEGQINRRDRRLCN